MENICNDSFRVDNNGFLRIEAILASASVLEYVNPATGEKLVGYIPVEELQKAISLIESTPLTLGHPKVGEVTPQNYKDLSVGYVNKGLEIREGKLYGEVVICREDAIKSVANHDTLDLSNGYTEYKDFTPGVFIDEYNVLGKGHHAEYGYDYVKRDIKLNHVALCEFGRSKAAELIFDHADYTLSVESIALDAADFQAIQKSKKTNMDYIDIIVGDQIVKVEKSSADAIKNLKQQAEDAMKSATDMQMQYDTMKAELEQKEADMSMQNDSISTLEGKVAAYELAPKTEVVADADVISKEVQSRFDAWATIGGQDNGVVVFDSALSEADIKRAWLKGKLPEMATVIDAADVNFVNGMFAATPKSTATPFSTAKDSIVGQAPVATKAPLTPIAADGSFSVKLR